MKIYWGEKGTYGPFSAQKDGWPNAGEVVRYYRLAAHMSLADLARAYGEATGTTVSKQWISLMERHNEVPNDITRRQALVSILHIPPILLGLASLEVALPEKQERERKQQRSLAILRQETTYDVALEETRLRAFWLLNETSQAHQVLEEVIHSIRQLEPLEKQASGIFHSHLQELLYSYYRLASDIHRDLLNLPTAFYYANLAVRIAKQLGRSDLIANTLFDRGFVRFIWGMYGCESAQGNLVTQREKLVEALQDYEQALPLARPQVKGLLQLEMSRLQALLSASAIDQTIALRTMDLAGKLVGSTAKSQDLYTNIVLDVSPNGLDEERYYLGRAITFNGVGRSDKAIETLDTLERLDAHKRRKKDQTRRHAFLEVVQAQTYVGMKEYPLATDKLLHAFYTFNDLDSVTNIAFIQQIYNSLCASSYRSHPEVQKLGKLLIKYYKTPRSHFS